MERLCISTSASLTKNQLMTTASVYAIDKEQVPVRCRALLDTCSTANFICEEFATALRLPKERCAIPVGTLNDLGTTTRHIVQLTIRSINNRYERTFDFLTIPRIADLIPNHSIPREQIPIPRNIRLADPEFHKPSVVHLLLGSGPTLSLLCVGQIDLSNCGTDLFLQKTHLGWVIGGNVKNTSRVNRPNKTICNLADQIVDLTRFWEIEEGPKQIHLSPEELACEEHFQRHTVRDETGRYVVALPFKNNPETLGDSQAQASKRLNSLRRKFLSKPKFKAEYDAIIREYVNLGHMTEISDVGDTRGFYLPHHAVIKESSATTKLRVVFDGSARSSSGSSLNNILMVGPTIQDDIFSLVLRFRLHNYVITADIEKMYRQFLVRKEDRKYQRVLWEQDGSIKTYELNTITFGLAAAPFLAIRCLHQLADDEKHQHPRASDILKRDLYVDDVLTGAPTIEEARFLRDELIQLLHRGGLKLRQWASNDAHVLDGISESNLNKNLQLSDDQALKTLGISWNAKQDQIIYSVKPMVINSKITKRIILSEIAKIFDPLGLLGPVILYAKILMQRLWQSKVDWDESVPINIHTSWSSFCMQLHILNNVSFSRRLLIRNTSNTQIHGFCDASESGYGACLYVRSEDQEGRVQANLFCAKSRVAPLKSVSLPRLELCSALLLAKLYSNVIETTPIASDKTVFWTDSMIALHWINTSPHLLKTFVANRVSEIQSTTRFTDWRHIRSQDNPADALSRGQLPSDFIQNKLWTSGPDWLHRNEDKWPISKIIVPSDIPETRKTVCLVSVPAPCDVLTRYSSYRRLVRIIAYLLRFKPDNHFRGPLQVDETRKSEKTIIYLIQRDNFAEEIRDLSGGRPINRKSKLLTLNPFVDSDNLLRVGGRLQNSDLPFEKRHPVILPRSHHVTDLIIQEHHVQSLHAGTQNTLHSIRQRFWLLDGRNQVRKIIRRCVTCFRANPPTTEYIMGNLPKERTEANRPFYNVGVDYCGPFFIKERKFRNRSRVKVYVAVFVCLAVRAVHLEVVTDMTTEAFIAALSRFVSRRGRPHTIHSDNGTNFKGANNELRAIYEANRTENHNKLVENYLCDKGIQWKFIPPIAPHFGGLWESTVKSFKHHVRRVVGDSLFTLEQFNTFAIEVEAILNSRPLTPVSTDPNDLLVLTPAHFLIGDTLTSLPTADHQSIEANRLSSWQHIQKVRQDFWTRWYKEYLNELNIRHKWTKGNHTIQEGSVVILKEDHLSPMQWALGRVIQTHPGADGVVRTVRVKTSHGEYDRCVKRLAPLPINFDTQH